MPDKINCDTHGQADKAYVCTHLTGDETALGFHRNDPTEDNPYPDAWCDDCEIIRAAHGGWDEESEKLASISLLCSGCYERTRIRNTRPAFTLDDLSGLRWKCGTCDEWHAGPCLDFGYSSPFYWRKELEVDLEGVRNRPVSFLDTEYCAVEDEHFFVRGIIALPIIGTKETFRWGVWGSLSREHFEKLRATPEEQAVDFPPLFSWLSTRLPEYPDTLSLKMYAHIQEPGQRPRFELDPSDHPLAQEYHHGILPERVRAIMVALLPATEQ